MPQRPSRHLDDRRARTCRLDSKLGAPASLEPALGEPAAASPTRILRRRPDQQPSLSYSQQQLWLIDQWDPGTPTYNVALPFRVRGPLDRDALASALRRLIDRHEVLRTVVEVRDDEPIPVVLERPSLDLRKIDLRHLPAAEAEAEAIRLATELSRRPFDFTRDPLLQGAALVHMRRHGPRARPAWRPITSRSTAGPSGCCSMSSPRSTGARPSPRRSFSSATSRSGNAAG